jgi:hypothetical protein
VPRPLHPSLAEVIERHDHCVAALEHRQRLGSAHLRTLPEFAGLSQPEILDVLATCRSELEAYGFLFVVAAAEADLRADLAARDAGSKGDPVRHEARLLALDTDQRPRLDDLVDLWRTLTGEVGHGPGSKFKAMLKRRHWLAHGRSWSDKSGVVVDVGDAFTRVMNFYARIQLIDPRFPRTR